MKNDLVPTLAFFCLAMIGPQKIRWVNEKEITSEDCLASHAPLIIKQHSLAALTTLLPDTYSWDESSGIRLMKVKSCLLQTQCFQSDCGYCRLT